MVPYLRVRQKRALLVAESGCIDNDALAITWDAVWC